MKAITLTQPWATLVAIGAKRFETRPHHLGGGGWDRLFGDLMLHQLIEYARGLQERGPDQHAGVAWSGGPLG